MPMFVKLDLKAFSEGAVTTAFGREFHTSTTRFEKTLDLTLSRDRGLKIFRLLPLVDSSDMVKNLSISTRSIWLRIL